MRILLIEDHPVIHTKALNFLTKEGHTVISARNLDEAILYLEMAQNMATPFDAILSDNQLKMPDGTISHARENYAAIREIAGYNVPILGASADIVMWERVKKDEEDDRLFIHRKTSDFSLPGNHQYWDEPWVKTTLDQVKDLPPLPKRRPRIIVVENEQPTLQSISCALEDAGYEVHGYANVKEADKRLMPSSTSRPGYVAIISSYQFSDGTGTELFMAAHMVRPTPPFLALGTDREQWTKCFNIAAATGKAFHLVPPDDAQLLAKLKELDA